MHRLNYAALLLCGLHGTIAAAQAVPELPTVQVLGTAEEEVKEALGVSVITADEIARRPPVNDLSDIVRREPGVSSNARGKVLACHARRRLARIMQLPRLQCRTERPPEPRRVR